VSYAATIASHYLTLSAAPFRFHNGAATVRGAALAGVKLQILFRILVEILVLVVVRELGTGGNALDRLDPDVPPFDEGITVRIARVIDEARIVSIECGVDDPLGVQREQKGVVTGVSLIRIPTIRFGVGDLLADVLDDRCAAWDVLSREGAQSLYG